MINFAVGEWAATGAFIGVAVLTTLAWPRLAGPYWLALLAVLAVLGVLGWLVELTTVRPLLREGTSINSPILALLGVLVIFREDHEFSLDPVIPRPGLPPGEYDFILASQPSIGRRDSGGSCWRSPTVAPMRSRRYAKSFCGGRCRCS